MTQEAERDALVGLVGAGVIGISYSEAYDESEDVEAIVDAILAAGFRQTGPAHDAQVRAEAVAGRLPEGAKWFPAEGGIMWNGTVYSPVDYVLTRSDIASLRAEAWDEGAKALHHMWLSDSDVNPVNPYRQPLAIREGEEPKDAEPESRND